MSKRTMGRAHVLAIPYPAQGHVLPLMEIAQCLAQNGTKVTFVNSEFNHDRITKALSLTGNTIDELIDLASIPDGLEPWEDRNDLGKLSVAMATHMPQRVEALVEQINLTEKITCVIADFGLTWVFNLARKLGIKTTAFLPASVLLLSLSLNAYKFVDQGIIDGNGTPLKQEKIQLSPEAPAINVTDLVWTRIGDLNTQKHFFNATTRYVEAEKFMDRIVCNSSYELEAGALKLVPQCVPIGPLLASNRLGRSQGHFWPEDSGSLSWLDQQPPNSTIYVAFGSFTIFNEIQFRELALGLELTGRPFVWVVRQDSTKEADECYPQGFKERIKNRGKIVDWAPQQKVLSHPSVACFLSHCGWNSTVEGTSNGVPFLCWPYFADQFLNQTYISDYWEVGLRLEKDECGIVKQGEINNKVELLMNDKSYKTRALNIQSKVVASATKGGCSRKNLEDFVDWINKK